MFRPHDPSQRKPGLDGLHDLAPLLDDILHLGRNLRGFRHLLVREPLAPHELLLHRHQGRVLFIAGQVPCRVRRMLRRNTNIVAFGLLAAVVAILCFHFNDCKLAFSSDLKGFSATLGLATPLFAVFGLVYLFGSPALSGSAMPFSLAAVSLPAYDPWEVGAVH